MQESHSSTNQVWTMDPNLVVEPLSAQMLTKRHSAVASGYEVYLAVAGGKNEVERDCLTDVEVYDGKQWIQVKSLPESLQLQRYLATVIHNGIWYLMEESDDNKKGATYYATLENLVLKRDDDWSSLKAFQVHAAPALFDNNVLIAGQHRHSQYSLLMLSSKTYSWVNITRPTEALQTTRPDEVKCMIGLPEKQLLIITSNSSVKIATVKGTCLVMYRCIGVSRGGAQAPP